MENPATGEIIASVPKGSAEDADRAVHGGLRGATGLGGDAAGSRAASCCGLWRG